MSLSWRPLGLLKAESCEAFRPGRTKGVTDATACCLGCGRRRASHPDGAKHIADALECEITDLGPAEVRSIVAAERGNRRGQPVWLAHPRPRAGVGRLFPRCHRGPRYHILLFAGTFLFDQVHRFTGTPEEASRNRVTIRFLTADPRSGAVALRGQEEGIGNAVQTRCSLAIDLLRPLRGLRTHEDIGIR